MMFDRRYRASLSATALGVLVACSGAPVAPVDVPPVVPDGEVLVVAASVTEAWLGGAWNGSPYRLADAVEAAPTPGACADGTMAQRDGPVDAGPDGLVMAESDRGEHVSLHVDAWRDSGPCAASAEWAVVAMGFGSVMSWDGGPETASDPGEVVARGGQLVAVRGWEVRGGRWIRVQAPVVARLARPDWADSRPLCAERDGPDAAEALATALLYERLASPGRVDQARQARAQAVDAIGGAVADLLAGAAATGTDDARACEESPTWLVAQLAVGAIDPEVVPATDAVGPAVRTLAATLALDAVSLDLAARLASSVLERAPRHGPASMVRAQIGEALGDPLATVAAAYEVAALDPVLAATAAYARGLLAEDAGDVGGAVSWFTVAHEADAAFAAPANALGFLAFEAGDVAAARTWFEQAVARDPAHAGAYNNLGYVAETVDGDPAGAREWYARALEADPASASAAFNMASVLERWHGELEEARALYARAVTLEPDHLAAREAIEALDGRPDASVERLAGTWSGTDGVGASLTFTAVVGGPIALVRRPPGGDPVAERFEADPAWVRGARLALRLPRPAGARVFEFVDEDNVVTYLDTDPVGTRVNLRRLTGGMASLGVPRGAIAQIRTISTTW